jgi:YjzC-like protein
VSPNAEGALSYVLNRYRPYGPVYKPGEKAPFSGTYICDRGTMLPPVRVQLTKGDPFPEAEGLSVHTRWHETNIQG